MMQQTRVRRAPVAQPEAPTDGVGRDMEPHGRLAPSSRAALRQQAIKMLLEPAHRELFARDV